MTGKAVNVVYRRDTEQASRISCRRPSWDEHPGTTQRETSQLGGLSSPFNGLATPHRLID